MISLLSSLLPLLLFLSSPFAAAEDGINPPAKKDDPGLFDQSSPYLEYGDFNTNEDEDSDSLYFQYGRFFGLSLGMGYETATGNRGLLYNPSFPRVDARIHYWFDFQFAMELGIFFANHSFSYQGSNYSDQLIGYGMDLKYYFDVRNASAVLTFSNPFLFFGAGAMSKTETSTQGLTPSSDSTFTVNIGAGLEFPITYKKTYFILEGLYATQSFADTSTSFFSQRVPNLNGGFISLLGHFLITW